MIPHIEAFIEVSTSLRQSGDGSMQVVWSSDVELYEDSKIIVVFINKKKLKKQDYNPFTL